MSWKTRSVRDERLRIALRQGDPAAAEPGPEPEEIRRLRRTILAASAENSEPRRWAFWLPALATTAAAALTLAVALGLWYARNDSTVRPRETGRQVVAAPTPSRPLPAPDAPTEEVLAAAPVAAPAPEETPRRSAALRPRSRRAATVASPAASTVQPALPDLPPMASVEPVPSLPPAEPPLRQVQLEAPGGTRVIWMLSTESVVEDLAD